MRGEETELRWIVTLNSTRNCGRLSITELHSYGTADMEGKLRRRVPLFAGVDNAADTNPRYPTSVLGYRNTMVFQTECAYDGCTSTRSNMEILQVNSYHFDGMTDAEDKRELVSR